ncbi:ankyrin repeat-containing domain protein [Dunaliella salina]|uniref:Ankyrin repeat-containing domain protein n=1 Tax=Dunaliella salina TaxID=3046 RepID=A0ABQ7GB12_DUNSA|nr:ankyrin repeat-containing domain protein [Dunaliella salina]|eukprot:KAF5831796.1 ankyrin repeat-containing domain protein [Dunaliella salina]
MQMQTNSNRAGAFDFSALASRLPFPQQRSSYKEGTLHAYAELGDMKGLERLVAQGENESKPSGMTLNQKEDVMGREAIHVAAQMGHSDVVKWMISKNAEPGATDNFGVTPLHLAAQNNDMKTMEIILAHHPKFLDVDQFKETPLHWAATKGSTDAVKLLIKKGSPVDPFNHPECATPLIRAAYNGHCETVQALLDLGANIHSRTSDGSNALHQACYMNHVGVIELLVSRANKSLINQPNAKNRTPLDMCLTDLAREALGDQAVDGSSIPAPKPDPAPTPAPPPAPPAAPAKTDGQQDPAELETEEAQKAEMARLLERKRAQKGAESEFP